MQSETCLGENVNDANVNDAMAGAKRAKSVRYIDAVEGEVIRLMNRRRCNRVYEAVVMRARICRPGMRS